VSDVREEARRQLDAVRQDFQARLGSMIEEIVVAWEAARGSSDQIAGMKSLVEFVHRLAGNAGFFGFNEVSRAAMNLEAVLDQRLAAATLDGSEVQHLSRLVGALRDNLTPAPPTMRDGQR